MTRGKYIVLEGPEGVGKTTQILELTRRLQLAGLPVRVLREPDSQSDLTARAIRSLTQDPRYPMNTRTEVLLYNAARSQSLQIIKQSVEHGVICVVDRNYLTTLAIQYYGRGDVPDYDTINSIISFAVDGIEPDLCIVLDAPANVLKERAKKRGAGERFDNLDEAFLERVRAGYLWEAKQRNLPVVYAAEGPEATGEAIWQLVQSELSLRVADSSTVVSSPASVKEIIEQKYTYNTPDQDLVVSTNNNLVSKINNVLTITNDGKEYLSHAITDTESNVYAFTDKLSPVTIAAAMARLSRRGDDMRLIILDEFAGQLGKDSKLLERVITAYGDDSVQQLGGLHFVVENASNILTKKLEWGRLASYLEQSTRYIYFDKKDANDKYRYHVPEHFVPEVKKQYVKVIDTIFENYSLIVHKLTDHVRNTSSTPDADRDVAWQGATRAQACDAARSILPVATTSTVGVFASGQALESLIMHLQSDTLPESRITGDELLKQARKVMPSFLQRADKPDRGGALIAYRAETATSMAKLAKDLLPTNHASASSKAVTLTDFWPKNELLLVPDMLYEHSNLPLESLQAEVSNWSYDKKVEVFKGYMGQRFNRRHKPGRAIEKAHYSWDIVCDYGLFRDLQRHRMVDDLNWQQLSPRFGYEIPELIEEAGLSELFEECFNLSLKLHSILVQSGYSLEAQYATLLGHKMRWKVTYNAREAFHLHELRTSPQGHPGYRKLVLEMHEKLTEIHPLMAEAMKFVNTEEDAELTRLAAERYTLMKLEKII